MGFRQGAYARLWSVDDMGRYSICNISISKKNKETNRYENEFSHGFVRLVGTAHEIAKELNLPTREEFNREIHKGISIKISSCDVTNYYDAENKKIYTNYVIFGFEVPEIEASKPKKENKKNKDVDELDFEEEDDLPF